MKREKNNILYEHLFAKYGFTSVVRYEFFKYLGVISVVAYLKGKERSNFQLKSRRGGGFQKKLSWEISRLLVYLL